MMNPPPDGGFAAPPPGMVPPLAPPTWQALLERPPAVVEFSLEGPRPQRRATVAFRLILVIPHLVYGWLLGFVGLFAVMVGWCAALVTGRLPEGIATFLARVAGYLTRVYGYLYLLTDRYPSFALDDDADYPISVQVPEGAKLNRLAVLFRLILVIPAGIVMSLVTGGLTAMLVLVWLVVFAAGYLPDSFFQAEAAILRYQARFWAFMGMLTSEYPRGLFGDRPLPGDAPITAPQAWPVSEPMAAPLGAGVPSLSPSASRPRVTRLVLSKAAKRIVVALLVIGVAFQGFSLVQSIRAGEDTKTVARLDADYDELVLASETFDEASQLCAIQGGISCLQDALGDFRSALVSYRERLQSTSLPQASVGLADEVDEIAAEMVGSLDRLGEISNVSSYQAELRVFQDLAFEFDAAWRELRSSVFAF